MKILCLAGEGREIYHTMHWPMIQELRKHKNVIFSKNPNMDQIKECDVVFCYTPVFYIQELQYIKKPKIAFIEDIWPPNSEGKLKHKVSHIIHKHCDCLFVRYKGNWIDSLWYKKWKRPWYYLPHCIDPQLFNNWNQEKNIGLLSVGQIRHKKKYHMRNAFIDTFQDREDFYRLEQGSALGKDFSKVINRAFITSSSNVLGRIFAKTFEIPASMSLLACNSTPNMEEAGFIPDENFIDVNLSNMKEKILYHLERPEKIKEMTLKGFKLVHERHTIQQRVKELLAHINDFMGVSNV